MAVIMVVLTFMNNAALTDNQLLERIAGPLNHHISLFDYCHLDVSRKIDHTSKGKDKMLVNERQLAVYLKDIGGFREEVSQLLQFFVELQFHEFLCWDEPQRGTGHGQAVIAAHDDLVGLIHLDDVQFVVAETAFATRPVFHLEYGVLDLHLARVSGLLAQQHPDLAPHQDADALAESLRLAVVLKPPAAQQELRVLKKQRERAGGGIKGGGRLGVEDLPGLLVAGLFFEEMVSGELVVLVIGGGL